MDFEELLKYVNDKLNDGMNVTQIAKSLGLTESTIRKRLNKKGYKRLNNQFVLTSENSNPTTKKEKIDLLPINNTSSTTMDLGIDTDKLKLLLDNIDNLLKLVPNTTCSTTDIILSSDETQVTSLRVNKELYKLVKDRAERDKCSISDIVNKSFMDYLKNYI